MWKYQSLQIQLDGWTVRVQRQETVLADRRDGRHRVTWTGSHRRRILAAGTGTQPLDTGSRSSRYVRGLLICSMKCPELFANHIRQRRVAAQRQPKWMAGLVTAALQLRTTAATLAVKPCQSRQARNRPFKLPPRSTARCRRRLAPTCTAIVAQQPSTPPLISAWPGRACDGSSTGLPPDSRP